jgi:hypothetical protein
MVLWILENISKWISHVGPHLRIGDKWMRMQTLTCLSMRIVARSQDVYSYSMFLEISHWPPSVPRPNSKCAGQIGNFNCMFNRSLTVSIYAGPWHLGPRGIHLIHPIVFPSPTRPKKMPPLPQKWVQFTPSEKGHLSINKKKHIKFALICTKARQLKDHYLLHFT